MVGTKKYGRASDFKGFRHLFQYFDDKIINNFENYYQCLGRICRINSLPRYLSCRPNIDYTNFVNTENLESIERQILEKEKETDAFYEKTRSILLNTDSVSMEVEKYRSEALIEKLLSFTYMRP